MRKGLATVTNPACRSDGESGCAQCTSAYACHDRRLGRPHLLWAPMALGLLLAVGFVLQ